LTSSSVSASFMLSDGTIADMSTSITDEAVSQQLLTSTLYSVAAVSIGQYAEGKSIVQIIQPPTALSGVCLYAYISRRGNIQAVLPVAEAGQQWTPSPMMNPMGNFEAGDTIVVFTSPNANAQRNFAYTVITGNNVGAIFMGQAASGNATATHILSGANIGAAITGLKVARHFCVSDEGSLITSGLYILNAKGLPVGACTPTDPSNQQVQFTALGGAPIALNYTLRLTCSA